MAKFSLVLATYDRVSTLDQLFESMAAQTGESIECIVVDQNKDDRLKPIVERWQQQIDIKVLRAAPQLSKARNQGIAMATGEFLAFPDDDCWYADGLLRQIREFFAEHPEYDFVTTGMFDKDNISSGNRWIQSECEVAPINIFRASSTQTQFYRRNAKLANVHFDEGIGPNSGTPFGCGEDTDFTLQAMEAGMRGYFKRAFVVHHPRKDMLSGVVDEDRALSYGRGMGHVMRKHRMGVLCAAFVLYDTLRAVVCRLTGRKQAASLCMAHGRGIKEGYRAG